MKLVDTNIVDNDISRSDESCIFSYDSGFCCTLNEKLHIVNQNDFDCANCKHRTSIKEYLIGVFDLDPSVIDMPLCLFCSYAVGITELSQKDQTDLSKVYRILCKNFSLRNGMYVKSIEDCESYRSKNLVDESEIKIRVSDIISFGEWNAVKSKIETIKPSD